MSKIIANVGELNSFTLSLTLQAADGTAALPSTLHWRMTCPDNEEEVQGWTELDFDTAPGADGYTDVTSAEIEVIASLHELVTTKDKERRAINVCANKDEDDEWNEDFVYYVERRLARS